MSNQSAKKTKQKNEETLRFLLLGIAIVNGIYFCVLLFLDWDSIFSWSNLFSISFFAGIYFLSYSQLSGIAASEIPLESKGGAGEYFFDLIYLTWFVQITILYSSWFWSTYLLVVGFVIFKFWTTIQPFLASQGKEEDPKGKKSKKDKPERPKIIKVRK